MVSVSAARYCLVQRDLARDVVAGLAVVGQAHGHRVHLVQRGHHAAQLVVVRAALFGCHAGQLRVPQTRPSTQSIT
jgi:hypothetical protein